MTSTYEQATARLMARGRSGDGIGYAPPVGDTAPLDTVAIKPRRAPRRQDSQQAFTASECDCRWGKSSGRTPIRRRPARRDWRRGSVTAR